MDLFGGDSLGSFLRARERPPSCWGRPWPPEVPSTLGSIRRAADTSPTPWRWPNCLINSENLGEGHLNAPSCWGRPWPPEVPSTLGSIKRAADMSPPPEVAQLSR